MSAVWFTYLLISKLIYLIYHLNFPIPLNILQKAVFKLLYCIPFGKRLGHMQKIITVVQTKYKFIFLTHKRSPEVDAATAAKSLQSCPTLCDPRDGSPPGSPVPGILQARTLERVAISFSNSEVDSSSLNLVEQLYKVCKLPNRDIVWSYEGLRERKKSFWICLQWSSSFNRIRLSLPFLRCCFQSYQPRWPLKLQSSHVYTRERVGQLAEDTQGLSEVP